MSKSFWDDRYHKDHISYQEVKVPLNVVKEILSEETK